MEKDVKAWKKLISTREGHAKHLLPGQNTQNIGAKAQGQQARQLTQPVLALLLYKHLYLYLAQVCQQFNQ